MSPVLDNRSQVPPTSHASNGSRLVSPTGETLALRHIVLTSEAAGGIARTTLRQHFANPHPNPLELTYTFPLPADGSLAGYHIEAGHRRINGRIERRDDARAQYDAARLEGRTAALVEQERPSLFTQRLGNIPPSTDVVVELTIDHPLAWIAGGAWEWRFPTVVAPRYLGAEGVVADVEAVTVDVANGKTSTTASVVLTVRDGFPFEPTSSTHSISVTDHAVTLAGDAALDRDIVIRWAARSQVPGCTLRRVRPAHADSTNDESAFALLTIVPPVAEAADLARDLILLLDVSGSMAGKPLEHLKTVATALINSLDEEDRLEMVAFSSGQARYRAGSVHTTSAEKRKACAWVGALAANGGTELLSAIIEALQPLRAGVPRQVVVVTDGLIGFEASVVRAIRDGLPPGSRLHTVGVGSASNRAFLRPAARAGRGVEIVVDLDDPAEEGAERIVAATREPVMVNLVLEGTALVDNAPRLPDLLSGSPVLAALRLRHEGGTLVVRGVTAHGTWVEQLDVPGTMPGDDLDAIPALWARETIEDLELDLACGGERKAIDRRIEDIGLRYTVSSRLTSWVAIAEEPTVDPRQPVRVERIPQALPYGMSAEGLGLGGAVSGIFSSVMEPSRSSGRVSFLRRPFSVADAHLRYPEMDRMAATVRAQFDRTRDLAMEQMARIEGLQHIFREIVKLTSESRSELFRPGVPPNEIEPLRRQLLDKLTDVEHALHKLQDPHLRVERLTADIEHLRHAVEDAIRRVTEQVALHGRVFPTPGRPTATLEIQVVSAFEWRPASTATVAERTVAIVEKGTTRPGLLVAGSLVHVELSADPKDIARAGEVEMRSGDDLLVIALGVTN